MLIGKLDVLNNNLVDVLGKFRKQEMVDQQEELALGRLIRLEELEVRRIWQ